MFDEQEKRILTEFVRETLRERQRARRWRLLSRLTIVAIVLGLFVYPVAKEIDLTQLDAEHTALVKLEGPIFDNAPASADNINSALREAYDNESAKAVVLEINTPGGSPVQAGRIYTEINRLRDEYPDKPLYAVVADICTSGGMYVAAAADGIYADRASIVGSIGVIIGGFGFDKAIEKLGVERRVLTAGEHKALLDPFAPQSTEELQHVQAMLDEIHRQFIDRVKQGRKGKLSRDADLFSGLIWTGEQAQALGLVDDFGDVQYVATELVKHEKIVDYSVQRGLLEELMAQTMDVLIERWMIISSTVSL